MIEDLVKLDEDQAIALFLEIDQSSSKVTKGEKKSKIYYVSPDIVVAKLERSPRYQFKVREKNARISQRLCIMLNKPL